MICKSSPTYIQLNTLQKQDNCCSDKLYWFLQILYLVGELWPFSISLSRCVLGQNSEKRCFKTFRLFAHTVVHKSLFLYFKSCPGSSQPRLDSTLAQVMFSLSRESPHCGRDRNIKNLWFYLILSVTKK